MASARTTTALRLAACLACVLAAACACGAGTARDAGGSGGATPTGTHAPSRTPTPPPPGTSLMLDERANGTTVSTTVGTPVVVMLHSTYWSGLTSSAPHVLAAVGGTRVHPAHNCPPGAGCGGVELSLRALRSGSADITAHRTSCGEALRCVGQQGRFDVTVKIGE